MDTSARISSSSMASTSDQAILWRRKVLVSWIPLSSATMPHRKQHAPYAPKASAVAAPMEKSRTGSAS